MELLWMLFREMKEIREDINRSREKERDGKGQRGK